MMLACEGGVIGEVKAPVHDVVHGGMDRQLEGVAMSQPDIRHYFKHGTLPQLRLFEAIARLGTFARAAQELHMAQPTASLQIKKLTATVGVPLFEQVGWLVPSALSTALLALGAAAFAIDRFAGATASWARSMKAESSLHTALEDFQLSWHLEQARLAGRPPQAEETERMIIEDLNPVDVAKTLQERAEQIQQDM